jgi:accessory colonization factor AcfC
MKKFSLLPVCLLFLTGFGGLTVFSNYGETATFRSSSEPLQKEALQVYGPGGPLGPIKEAAEKFSAETGIKVEVTAGPESKWVQQAKLDADLIYGGSEYMLRNFMFKHPGMIDGKTQRELYPRSAGILVRKGNPKKIKSLKDLTKPGIKIVDVNGAGQLGLWEDLAGRKGLIAGVGQNIDTSVETSAEAINLWKTNSKLDAWITYESWHYRLKDVTDLIEFPEDEKIYRGTPIAITNGSNHKKEAKKFIEYLQTESAHEIFQKWGWK